MNVGGVTEALTLQRPLVVAPRLSLPRIKPWESRTMMAAPLPYLTIPSRPSGLPSPPACNSDGSRRLYNQQSAADVVDSEQLLFGPLDLDDSPS